MGSDGGPGWYGTNHTWIIYDDYIDCSWSLEETETEESKRIRESRQHGPQKNVKKGKVKRW
jgi:hypothetical protein